jgi:hypothetical protein
MVSPWRSGLILVLALSFGLSLVFTSNSATAAVPESFQFVSFSAEVDPTTVEPMDPGCLTAFVSNLSAARFMFLNPSSPTNVHETLAGVVMDVTNSCTGQVEHVIVATEISPSAFRFSGDEANVVADIPYADTVVHIEVSWVCTKPQTTSTPQPGTVARGCPARATGIITFRSAAFSLSATGFLSKVASHTK